MTNRKLIYLVSFLFLVIGITACNNNKILSKDKMVEVLHDIQVAEAIHQIRHSDFNDRVSKDALIEGVLKKHGITQAELDSSLVWYSDNVDLYLKVNDSIITTLKRDVDIVNEETIRRSHRRNNINFSILPEFSYLTNANPTLPFSIDSFQIQRFPDFEIELKTLWMQNDMDADFSVSFVYSDTTLVESQKIDADGHYKISRPDKSERLKYILGYVHLDTEDMRPDRKVLLYDISIRDLKRDSIKVAETDSIKVDNQIED